MPTFLLKNSIIVILFVFVAACSSDDDTDAEKKAQALAKDNKQIETIVSQKERTAFSTGPDKKSTIEQSKKPVVTAKKTPDTTIDNATVQPDEKALSHKESIKKANQSNLVHPNDNKDFWTELREHFYLSGKPNKAAVKKQIDLYLRDTDSFEKIFVEAQPYIYYVYQEVMRRGLPAELVLLPVIESHYNPKANSYVGAAGLWQLMPVTGGGYGLKENWWYDGRLDVVASTKAALAYLTYLSDLYDGDWALALAAYNSGQGTVHNAIRKNKNRKKSTNYWQLVLPKETRDYVPRFIAVLEIVKNPRKYGVNLPEIPDKPFFAIVPIEHQVNLKKAAKLAGISDKEMRNLNTGYKHSTTSPSGPTRLLLPVTDVKSFVKNYEALPAKDKKVKTTSWRYYTVKSGDSLGNIAHKFNSTIPAIIATNHLKDSTIRVGSTLKIPASTHESKNLVAKSKKPATKKQTKTENTQTTKSSYHVKPGDSLSSIAKHYHVSVADLAAWNKLKQNSVLHTGQRLTIWEPAHHYHNSTAKTEHSNTYTVKSGDTLSRIATQYGISPQILKQENNLNSDALAIGETLKIPVN